MSVSILRKKAALGLIIAALVAGLGAGTALWRSFARKTESYRQVPVQRGTISLKVLATGVVQPENRLEIKPPIPGRVESVLTEEGRTARKGQILAWMSSTERAALLDAARARGAEEVKRWEEMYRPTPIVAPIDGTIILRKVEPGQTFTAQDAVLVMSNRLTVKAQVDETDIGQIRLKQKAEIVLDAYSGETVPGTVAQIAFEAKTVNNVTTYVVDVAPEKVPAHMRSGMTANVTFLAESRASALLVPNEAIRSRDGAATVLKAGARDTSAEVALKTGITDGRMTEVLSGLAEGETILIPSHPNGESQKKKRNRPSSPFGPQRHR